MTKRIIGTTIGFILFIYGFLSMILSLSGLQFTYLTFLDMGGKGLGFVLRLLMIVIGFVLIAFFRTDWEDEKAKLMEE